MQHLSETYSWALDAPIESLIAGVSASASMPLVAVGSGGSFTAAHLACALHQHYTGMVSKPVTPLELISSPFRVRSLAAMILSAGGSNIDIISAFENIVEREPRRCMVLCLRKDSKLTRRAHSYRFVDLLSLNPPSFKDGFLATNSLLAFSVLLVRAYAEVFSKGSSLPHEFEALLSFSSGTRSIKGLLKDCAPLWKRETIIVLYGPSVASAALDLESKFSEGALGNTQLADFRNFAHGRHHWIAKRGSKTGVLAIFANDEIALAERTLRLIPATVPVARICLPSIGPVANIEALIAVFHLVGAAGEQQGIDPGRPSVPEFGRRIYSLRVAHEMKEDFTSPEKTAIARKLGCEVQELQDHQDFNLWQDAYRHFVERLEKASFGAILFDYDGTLCDERDRFLGLREDIIHHLTRLLQSGILIGVATGRGKSVREDLQKVLPKKLWRGVYLGYYNGSDLADLCDDRHPKSSLESSEALKAVLDAVSKHPIMSAIATYEARQTQISVQPKLAATAELSWRVLQQLAHVHGLRPVRSSHSIDLVQQDVSKRSLLALLEGKVASGAHVLLIGDKGQWPGNDYDLLSAPDSLSVDEVSADPDTCWNLAIAGCRGVQATLAYLDALQIFGDTFKISVCKLTSLGLPLRSRR